MLLQVHDELLFEHQTPKDTLAAAVKKWKEYCSSQPLLVEITTGDSWLLN